MTSKPFAVSGLDLTVLSLAVPGIGLGELSSREAVSASRLARAGFLESRAVGNATMYVTTEQGRRIMNAMGVK